jgi:hypothetical protein
MTGVKNVLGSQRNLHKISCASYVNLCDERLQVLYRLCDELAQITRNFWWGNETDRKKTHWKAWEKIAVPKLFGGVGFKDPRSFN